MKYVYITLASLFWLAIAPSCNKESSCAELAERVRDDYCNIIVSDFSTNEYRFYLKGRKALTGQVNTFRRVNYLWGYWFVDKIAKGDTVVKKKGELKFYVHKRGAVLAFPFECDGQLFE